MAEAGIFYRPRTTFLSPNQESGSTELVVDMGVTPVLKIRLT